MIQDRTFRFGDVDSDDPFACDYAFYRLDNGTWLTLIVRQPLTESVPPEGS